MRLKRLQGMSSEPVVLKNVRYWGAPRNDGFVLMPNEVEGLDHQFLVSSWGTGAVGALVLRRAEPS